MHAEAVDRKISIARLKARLKALALTPVRHRVDLHRPSVFEQAEKEKKE